MSDISVLEGRLQAALERIGRAIDDVPTAAPVDASVLVEKAEAFEAENATLREQLAAQEAKIAALEEASQVAATAPTAESPDTTDQADKVASLEEALTKSKAEADRWHRTAVDLQRKIRVLRKKNANNLGDAGLVNSTLETELAALQALHDADRAELDAILAELAPMTEATENA